MLPISSAFAAALDKPIRDIGLCYVKITFSDNTEYEVNQYKVESLAINTKNDPLSRRFPTETATLTLIDFEQDWHPDNPNTIMTKLENPASVIIKIGIMINGTPEWSTVCKYLIIEKPSWSNYRATIQMTRQLGAIAGRFYQFDPDSDDLKDVADAVFDAADNAGTHSYGTNLSHFPLRSHQYLPVCPAQDALLWIASASGSSLQTAWTGIVYVTNRYLAHPEKHTTVIRQRDMFQLPTSEKLTKIRNEIVNARNNPYAMPSAEEVLDYSSSEEPDGSESLFLQFEKPIIASTISYALTNIVTNTFVVRLYKTGICPVHVDRVDNTQPYRIVVSATPATPRIETKIFEIDSTGFEDETVENPLISMVRAEEIAEYRGGYLANTRNLYTFSYRGDPSIEALDLIRVELPFEGIKTCIVLESTFKYGNGFSGSLTVRKLDSLSASQTIITAISDDAISDEAITDETLSEVEE